MQQCLLGLYDNGRCAETEMNAAWAGLPLPKRLGSG